MSENAARLNIGNARFFAARAMLESTVSIHPHGTNTLDKTFYASREGSLPMKILKIALLVCSLGLSGMAQSKNQAGVAVRTDLTSTLLELDRIAAATNSDIGHLQIEKWKGGWKTGFTTSTSHRTQAGQSAKSLERNLKTALPDLIRAALNSRGGMYTTFKVYEDVNLVCQTLDSLVSTAEEYGRKEEYTPLAGDYNNLVRLRRSLSAYIEQKAAAADARIGTPSDVSDTSPADGASLPRKITVDSVASTRKRKTHSSND